MVTFTSTPLIILTSAYSTMPHAMSLRLRQSKRRVDTTRKCSTASRKPNTAINKPHERSRSRKIAQAHRLESASKPVLPVRFPLEVWMMIVVHIPYVDLYDNDEAICTMEGLPPHYRERHHILRALAQSCKLLRDLVLSLSWMEVETCARESEDDIVPRNRFAAYVLRQHSLGLLRTPIIASFVKTFTVSLHEYPIIRFLKPFARCLAALPNLRSLRVILCDLPPTTLEAEFRRRCYPQIKDLIIPVDAYPLLQAFPQITKLTVTRSHSTSDSFHDHGDELYEAIYANCHQLTSLMTDAFVHPYKLSWDGARRPDHGQRLTATAPNLDTVIISVCLSYRGITSTTEKLRYLSELPNLAHVKINLLPATDLGPEPYFPGYTFDTKAQTCFDTVKKILEDKEHDRPKSLVLCRWHMPGRTKSPSPPPCPVDFASWTSTEKISSGSISG